jgi:segregation and condensation protein B
MSQPDEKLLPAASSLPQVAGALVFGADHPLTVDEIRACLREVATEDAQYAAFAEASVRDVRDALESLGKELSRLQTGVELVEVGGAFRFQTEACCGRWLRCLLRKERPNRLSRPALETLAIIAYRQPIAKSEIEGIRGVTVDHILKALMELHLVRIVGRSDLPGRPFLYGTTATFLEHFGLKNLGELNEMDPTLQPKTPGKKAAPRKSAKTEGAGSATPAAADAVAELLQPAAAAPGAEPVLETPAP